jgi:type II restriction enzyme
MAQGNNLAYKTSINNIDVSSVRPFIKWVGGKRQLLPVLLSNLPDGLGTAITKYAEPFVGGGALLFELLKNYNFDEIFINDMNIGLVRCYESIRDNLSILSQKLQEIQSEYYALTTLDEKSEYFYGLRSEYNRLLSCENKLSHEEKNSNVVSFSLAGYKTVDLAAKFIALNKTCFNGMYRVNAKGEYNVPFGKSEEPLIYDEQNLFTISHLLKNVSINHGGYEECDSFIDDSTFVYFDPPYRPITNTAAFTSYTKDGFNDQCQEELALFAQKQANKGAKILLSNSDPKNHCPNDDFFDELYSWANIERVGATRMINCNNEKRGKINEILVRSYGDMSNNRSFGAWFSMFKKSIATPEYYVDFTKVHKNVDSIKVELNILNSLIGSKNIEVDFRDLLNSYPTVLKCLPILLAVRGSEIYYVDDIGEHTYNFLSQLNSVDEYCDFMKKTGLFELLSDHIIKDLVDYVTGVETGLDSNGRKNRGGHIMEDVVETYIKKAGFIKDKDYFKEMYLSDAEEKWGVDLSSISNTGKTAKRFDFVIKTPDHIYAIETNFYAKAGSKLNETARSYKNIALESKKIDDFSFVWFTDGEGWKGSKNNLEETFDVLDDIYSISDLEGGIIEKVFV